MRFSNLLSFPLNRLSRAVNAGLSEGILTYRKRGDDMVVQNYWPTSPIQPGNATSSYRALSDVLETTKCMH
jgi:hypothetical protein